METILISTGLGCIIVAIIGGGLEAFNVKVPSMISSVKRQVLLGVFGILVLAIGIYKNWDSTAVKGTTDEKEKQKEKETENRTLQTFYKDEDGDGYGNKLVTIQAESQPANYVLNTTDCDDKDYYAHPEQTSSWFDRKNKKGNYDYNCDNIETKEYKTLYRSVRSTDHREGREVTTFKHYEGWKEFIPDCGKSGTYVTVVSSQPREITRTQRCN